MPISFFADLIQVWFQQMVEIKIFEKFWKLWTEIFGIPRTYRNLFLVYWVVRKKTRPKKLLKLNASISGIFSNSFFAKVLLDSYLFFHKKNTLVFQKRSILILKLEDFRWHFIVLRIPPFLKNKTIETSDPKIWKQRFCHCHYLRVSWTARLPSIAVLSGITLTITYSVALPSCWA